MFKLGYCCSIPRYYGRIINKSGFANVRKSKLLNPVYSSIRRVMEKFNNDKPITPDVAPGTIVRFVKD